MITLGSEMSGGMEDIRADDITAINTESGIRIKTTTRRICEGYMRQGHESAYYEMGILDGRKYRLYPHGHYNLKARPVVQGINYRDFVVENVTMAAQFKGISGDPFTGICISNVTIGMNPKSKEVPWTCVDVKGIAGHVTPRPCSKLIPKKVVMCAFPEGSLPIDEVKLKRCVYKVKHP